MSKDKDWSKRLPVTPVSDEIAKVYEHKPVKPDTSATRTNRGLDAVIKVIEEQNAQHLELQRRLQKLETHLRLMWVPDNHYDGEYKPL